jgi:transcriptional regulator with XRE-family HTH domain
MQSIGTILKAARLNINLKLLDVEKATGISNSYLSQLENNKIKSPSISILSKLSGIYRVPLKILLVSANLIDETKDGELERNFNFAQKLAFRAEDLTEEERNQLLNYLEFLKTKKSNA